MFTARQQLEKRITEIIVGTSWLEEMNPADAPAYEMFARQRAILEAQLIALDFTNTWQ